MIKKNNKKQTSEKLDFSVYKFVVWGYILLSDMQEFQQILFPFVFAAKIFDFCASLGDMGARVPTRKLHTRPGYINTLIFPGLI